MAETARQPGSAAGAKRHFFLPALTSVRGIAAWYVVLYHFREYLPDFGLGVVRRIVGQGYLSVDLFFELSGFVIGLNYLGLMNGPGPATQRIARFLWLRLGRIYPLHIVMLCAMVANPIAIWLFSGSGAAQGRYDPADFVLSVFLVQAWGFVRDVGWNIPAWSISTEWFVYLIFPVIAWAVRGQRFGAAGWAAMLIALVVVLAGGSTVMGTGLGADNGVAALFRCLMEFLTGLAVYRVWDELRRTGSALCGDGAMLGAMVLAVAYGLLPVADVVVMPVCFALVIYALADTRSVSARLMRLPLLEWIGTISYSTYLTHYMVRDWVKFLMIGGSGPQIVPSVVYVGVTLAASAALYRLVEVPGRTWFRAHPPGLMGRVAAVADR